MHNEDLKYLFRSTILTIIPVFIIIILTEYILGFILSRTVIIDFTDITIRSVFFSQTIGIFNLLKYQKSIKRRDEFEKIITLRVMALNVILYLVGVIILMFALGFAVNYFSGNYNSLNFISEKVLVNVFFLALISLYKLKVSKDILAKH